LGLLRLVRVLPASIDKKLLYHGIAQLGVRQHATNTNLYDRLRLAAKEVAGSFPLKAARVSGIAKELLLV
jgi:hypothetical protein